MSWGMTAWGDRAWSELPPGCPCCGNTGPCCPDHHDSPHNMFCCNNTAGPDCVKLIMDGGPNCTCLTGYAIMQWDASLQQWDTYVCDTSNPLNCLSVPHGYKPLYSFGCNGAPGCTTCNGGVVWWPNLLFGGDAEIFFVNESGACSPWFWQGFGFVERYPGEPNGNVPNCPVGTKITFTVIPYNFDG